MTRSWWACRTAGEETGSQLWPGAPPASDFVARQMGIGPATGSGQAVRHDAKSPKKMLGPTLLGFLNGWVGKVQDCGEGAGEYLFFSGRPSFPVLGQVPQDSLEGGVYRRVPVSLDLCLSFVVSSCPVLFGVFFCLSYCAGGREKIFSFSRGPRGSFCRFSGFHLVVDRHPSRLGERDKERDRLVGSLPFGPGAQEGISQFPPGGPSQIDPGKERPVPLSHKSAKEASSVLLRSGDKPLQLRRGLVVRGGQAQEDEGVL